MPFKLGTGLGTKQLRTQEILISDCFYYGIFRSTTHTSSANNPYIWAFQRIEGVFGYTLGTVFTNKSAFSFASLRACDPARWLAFLTFVSLIGLATCFGHRVSVRPKFGIRCEFGRSQGTNLRALKIRTRLRRDFYFVSSEIPMLRDGHKSSLLKVVSVSSILAARS